MIGRLFRLLAGLSMLLLISVAALWIRNYWGGDQLQIQVGSYSSQRDFAIRAVDGRIRLFYSRLLAAGQQGNSSHSGSWYWPIEFTYSPVVKGSTAIDDAPMGNVNTIANLESVGFVVRKQDMGKSPAPVFRSWELRAPSWFAMIVLAILPAVAGFVGRRERQRERTGKCTYCGYDLRGSHDRCPECGMSRLGFTGNRPL